MSTAKSITGVFSNKRLILTILSRHCHILFASEPQVTTLIKGIYVRAISTACNACLTTGDVTATVIIPTAYVLLRAFGGNFSLRHSQDVEVDEMLQQNGLRPDDVIVSCVSTIDAEVVAIVEIQTLLEAAIFAKLHGFAVSRFITRLPHDLHLPPFVFQAPAPIQ